MKAHSLKDALTGLPLMQFKTLSAFNDGTVGIFKAEAGISPWECHPQDDELLYVIDGAVTLTVLPKAGPAQSTLVEKGAFFIVPKGLWHRHEIDDHLSELYLTPGPTEHSKADDPRK
ncbi:MAG: cupin domain-containing protein [Alphaproteobacteria bacterium]